MNRLTVGLFIASLLLAGCAENNIDGIPVDSKRSPEFYASFEDNAVSGTKTYVDGKMTLRWTKDDRVSIFVGNTYNQEYKYAGETGANNGTFSAMQTPGFVAADKLDANYAVYPYSAANEMDKDGGMAVTLPAVQQYAENSFGLGANTMVAVTEDKSDMILQFKNLCGYLVVKLYGEGTVSSVMLEGNNGEKISGRADIQASYGTLPSIEMAEDATTSITIDCGEGVTLGTTAETATEFWFCIPPVTFTEGFTIKVQNSDGMGMTKSVISSRTVTRNTANTMAPLQTLFETSIGTIAFEDANFKAYCVQHFDTDGDGEISENEAEAISTIDCSKSLFSTTIVSLKGIEHFLNLVSLDFSGQSVVRLDISQNASLSNLICSGNQLIQLDVSGNDSLSLLDCSPMNDNSGNNTLKYVIVNSTQSLEGITINRSNGHIPDETQIIVKGQGGDNEDYREGGEG